MEEQNEKQTEAVQDARPLARTHEDTHEDAPKASGRPTLETPFPENCVPAAIYGLG
jgi:hypothetical protein